MHTQTYSYSTQTCTHACMYTYINLITYDTHTHTRAHIYKPIHFAHTHACMHTHTNLLT